jgi:hypothetical protein
MTANEMAEKLELRLDRLAASAPSYTDDELSKILNTAQWIFVKTNISPKTNAKQEGFEETEIRTQGLSNLIGNAVVTASSSQTDILPNGKFFDLPDDFYLTLSEQAVTNVLDCTDTTNSNYVTVPIKPVTHDEYAKWKTNYYKKPYVMGTDGVVWRIAYSREIDGNLDITAQTNKRHELLTDGNFTVSSYKLRYLKVPPEIVVDFLNTSNQRHCILDESTHDTIIEIAKKLLKEDTDRQEIVNQTPLSNLE